MIMSSVSRDSFISSFPICIPFVSFTCLIALSRTSSKIFKISSEMGHPCSCVSRTASGCQH